MITTVINILTTTPPKMIVHILYTRSKGEDRESTIVNERFMILDSDLTDDNQTWQSSNAEVHQQILLAGFGFLGSS